MLDDEVVLDEHGLLHLGGRWVALSPLEEVVMRHLLGTAGQLVTRDRLYEVAWPDRRSDARSLDTKVHRLRRRIAPLGLELRTVRGRGYVLVHASGTRQEAVPRS